MQMRKYKLGDIATLEISGVDKKIKDGEEDIRLCNFVDVYYNWAITMARHDSFMLATARTNEISKFQLKKGQVALTKDSETRDDIGISTYIADDFDDVILGYHCALITPNKDILDGRYLNALMHTDYAKKYFAFNASGSGQRYALSAETLNSFPVPVIPLQKQKQIGEIFSALDKKIELNKQINQNLEAMAKQLYDYWFVQFDFPNEEGMPYKSSSQYWENGTIPFFGPTDYNGNIFQIETADHITQDGLTHCTSSLFEEGVIIITARGSIGKQVIIGTPMAMNQSCYALRSKTGEYEYLYFLTIQLIECLKAKASGSVFKSIIASDIENSLLCIAESSIITRFCESVRPFLQKIKENIIEISNLTKQRDELLPLLMNGQVSVNSDLSHD